jgi:hypothetical protein
MVPRQSLIRNDLLPPSGDPFRIVIRKTMIITVNLLCFGISFQSGLDGKLPKFSLKFLISLQRDRFLGIGLNDQKMLANAHIALGLAGAALIREVALEQVHFFQELFIVPIQTGRHRVRHIRPRLLFGFWSPGRYQDLLVS